MLRDIIIDVLRAHAPNPLPMSPLIDAVQEMDRQRNIGHKPLAYVSEIVQLIVELKIYEVIKLVPMSDGDAGYVLLEKLEAAA